jgi:hypothetical protein
VEAPTSTRLAYCDITAIVTEQENVISQKRRGPAPTGKGTPVLVRLQPKQLAALDVWIKRQPKPKPSRPEAIRRLIELALAAKKRSD